MTSPFQGSKIRILDIQKRRRRATTNDDKRLQQHDDDAMIAISSFPRTNLAQVSTIQELQTHLQQQQQSQPSSSTTNQINPELLSFPGSTHASASGSNWLAQPQPLNW